MMPSRSVLPLLFIFYLPLYVFSQDPMALKYAETITQDDLYSYLSVLAADSLEGRETGKPGQKKAAEFIRSHFIDFGLQPVAGGDYLQHFELHEIKPGIMKIQKGENIYKNGKDFLMYGPLDVSGETETELVFAGKGSEEEMESLDLQGKAVVFFYKSNSEFKAKTLMAQEYGCHISFGISRETKKDFQTFRDVISDALARPSIDYKKDEDDKHFLRIFTHLEFIAELLDTTPGKLKNYEEFNTLGISTSLRIIKESKTRTFITENVLGYIEGTDKKDELLVITAHYDHEGIINGKIYNGADDDASGTSAIMEIGEAFALAKKEDHGPRRSILIMAVTGEEKGLFGSEYYSDHPVFPLENTVTNLNIDMIGRQDEEHKDNPDYVYLIGTKMLSNELHELSEEVNRTYSHLSLDYKFNDKDDPRRFYYRSDHYNFAKHNIPVIFYFNGTHADYHRPTDTVDKINFEKLQKISRFVFYTAWELANRDERVSLNH